MINRRRSEAARIRAQYRDVLVDVAPNIPRASEELGVASIDALVKLAHQVGSGVRRLADPWTGADVFFVDDGGVRYRYRAEGRPVRRRAVTV